MEEFEFVGGPLDGAKERLQAKQEEPFLIFQITAETAKAVSYACYRLSGNKLLYVSSKSQEEFLAIGR